MYWALSSFSYMISTQNMATIEPISVWICCSCYAISSDRFCKMMNVTLMALMVSDTANVMTHHAFVGVCSGCCVSAYATIFSMILEEL
jgi:hypothetical protein